MKCNELTYSIYLVQRGLKMRTVELLGADWKRLHLTKATRKLLEVLTRAKKALAWDL
jgi:hypothetical protein